MFHVKHLILFVLLLPILTFSQQFGSTTLPVKVIPGRPSKDLSVELILQKDSGYRVLGPEEKEWFYWTNYSRSNPKRFWDSAVSPILAIFPTLVSPYTASLKTDLFNSNSISLLKTNDKLLRTSYTHASELASKSASPSHTSPSGSSFSDRMKAAGIMTCAGENISFGPSDALLMLVLLYIDQGVAGLGHRKALLNPVFTDMGIGIGKYSNNNTIVIQDFACSQK